MMMQRAFTLVEMLVTIAVIGILIAIILPALAHARNSGRKVVCLSNLRSLGFGLQVYLDDGDGLLPRADWQADLSRNHLAPFDLVARHLEATWPPPFDGEQFARSQPWMCPSDRFSATTTGVSYSYTPVIFFHLFLEEERPRRWVSQMFLPYSSSILFMDSAPWHGRDQWAGRNGVQVDGSARQLDKRGIGITEQ